MKLPAFCKLRSWRMPRVVLGLMVLEYPLTVALLVLFGVATPDSYRSKLWLDGAENGFNSHPNEVLYAYANYRPVNTPLVWSQFLTSFNLVIIVLSLFFLLAKTTMYIMHIFFPLLSLLLHSLLLALYAYSVHGQTAPDTIDPDNQVNGPPWYITKSCNEAHDSSNEGFCQQAKASFYVTVFMLVLFCIHFVLALWSLVKPKSSIGVYSPETETVRESPESDVSTEEKWQMHQYPTMPASPLSVRGMKGPMTPRTKAFHDLGA